MIVTFIYRYAKDPTIYYGKYIGENMSDDSDNITLSDFLMQTLSPYFSIQFDDYNCDEKIIIGIMAMIPSVEDNCFSENEKNIFDLFYIRENAMYIPDVYLNGVLVKELIEE